VTRFWASAALVVALDQATKALAHRFLAPVGSVRLLGEVARLHYVHNSGAAFSLFRGSWLFFVGVSIASIALLIYLVRSRRYVFRGSTLAFGLVLGGAVGNLIDRFWLRQVIDFVDVGVGPHRWPTFNVADIGITVGVVYLAFGFLVLDARARPAAPAEPGHE
jgi:signal peptidase II